ncbi:Protein prenyltransferase alpha subunit repeat-containing protein 1 [Holothuria leucospilota]|uniref:Protein prenyltransferase alpha subunit repeat-containing protein 1 n=1 Tax=Holothuria leucospilota TaxID=206669 RepID=A0A9Q1BNE2_HOLLE|nr:Protein prenyltransferase alpha subunit repeat-containing protein 1 [Holothuria leucospilota]
MSHDFLAKRVVSDFSSTFRKYPRIDEFGLIYCLEPTINKSPVKVEGTKLGVETWCMKFVLPFIHRELLLQRRGKDEAILQQYSKVALLLSPECSTFWNIRKELLLRKQVSVISELKFTNIILTCHPKSPETFVHKRWILNHCCVSSTQDGCNDSNQNRFINSDHQLQTLIHSEIEGSRMAASRYPSNYNAWSHMIWTVKVLAGSSTEVLLSELSDTRHWVREHVSDHSGCHYRQFLLSQLGPENTLTEALGEEFRFVEELMVSYPGHEALWNHRRALYHLAVQRNKESSDHKSRGASDEGKPKMAKLQDTLSEYGGSTCCITPGGCQVHQQQLCVVDGTSQISLSALACLSLEKQRVHSIVRDTFSADQKIQEVCCKRYLEWLERFQT